MNPIQELLEAAKYNDGIEPEFSQTIMGEYIINLVPEEFAKLAAQLKIVSKINR